MSNKKDIIDLDALAPDPKTVKFEGQEVLIEPPTTEQIVKLMRAGSKMKGADGDNFGDETEEAIVSLEGLIKDIVPELKEKKINFAQTIKLMNITMDMAMPQDNKVLEERGIKVDSDPKAEAA